jgi:hypothetical protein
MRTNNRHALSIGTAVFGLIHMAAGSDLERGFTVS